MLLLLLLACPGDKAADSRPDSRRDSEAESTGDSDSSESASNARPPAPSPLIVEAEDGGLSCAAEPVADPDGDSATLSYAWEADSGYRQDGPEVAPEDAARGRIWTCTATANDAAGPGEPGFATWTASGPVPWQYAFRPAMQVAYGADLVALDDGTLLVATLAGQLVWVDPAAGTTLGELSLVGPEDELISVALDPEFGDGIHSWLYFWTSQSCRLGRVWLDMDSFEATDAEDLASYGCSTDGGHSSGELLFWQGESAEPVLYLAAGPVGSLDPQDDSDEGQGLFAWTVDRETGALSPAFSAGFENPAQVASGLRNPWRLIDCGAALCLADPGHDNIEEIELYTGAGMNFGAGEVEGPDPGGLYDDPVRYWDHHDPAFVDDDPDGPGELRFVKVPMLGLRVSSVAYSGRLVGRVLYGDLYDGWIRALQLDEAGTPGDDVGLAHRSHIMAMAETPDGTVWALELGGTLQRLILRGDRARVGQTGDLLSESSFVDGGIEYDVRYPLWSNGAAKSRMLQLPTGETIDVSDPDAWEFPVGTRLWKTFSMDGANVETRVLERQAGGWVGGVYLWEGDEARLTDGTRQELLLPGGGYTVPSEESCAFCHEATPGEPWPLGLEPFQLGEAGLAALSDALSGDPGPVPEVAGETETEAIAIRGALHGNCAFCHHPGGLASTISETSIDLSFDAESTGLVGGRVNYYHDLTPYGPPTEYLVVPGDPDQSVLLEILEQTDMPPLATWREDTALTEAIGHWILGL